MICIHIIIYGEFILFEFDGVFSNAGTAGKFISCCIDLCLMDGDISAVESKENINVFNIYYSFYDIEKVENEKFLISENQLIVIILNIYANNKFKFLSKSIPRKLHPPMARPLGKERRKYIKAALQKLPKDQQSDDLHTLVTVL